MNEEHELADWPRLAEKTRATLLALDVCTDCSQVTECTPLTSDTFICYHCYHDRIMSASSEDTA